MPASPTFRRDRCLLAIGACAGGLAILWSCDLFACRYPDPGAAVASWLRVGVFVTFVLAALFAVQAITGLTLLALLSAWRARGSGSRLMLAAVVIVALVILASILQLVFESRGVGAPMKRRLVDETPADRNRVDRARRGIGYTGVPGLRAQSVVWDAAGAGSPLP